MKVKNGVCVPCTVTMTAGNFGSDVSAIAKKFQTNSSFRGSFEKSRNTTFWGEEKGFTDTAAHNGRRLGGHYYREFNMLNKEEYRVFMGLEETDPIPAAQKFYAMGSKAGLNTVKKLESVTFIAMSGHRLDRAFRVAQFFEEITTEFAESLVTFSESKAENQGLRLYEKACSDTSLGLRVPPSSTNTFEGATAAIADDKARRAALEQQQDEQEEGAAAVGGARSAEVSGWWDAETELLPRIPEYEGEEEEDDELYEEETTDPDVDPEIERLMRRASLTDEVAASGATAAYKRKRDEQKVWEANLRQRVQARQRGGIHGVIQEAAFEQSLEELDSLVDSHIVNVTVDLILLEDSRALKAMSKLSDLLPQVQAAGREQKAFLITSTLQRAKTAQSLVPGEVTKLTRTQYISIASDLKQHIGRVPLHVSMAITKKWVRLHLGGLDVDDAPTLVEALKTTRGAEATFAFNVSAPSYADIRDLSLEEKAKANEQVLEDLSVTVLKARAVGAPYMTALADNVLASESAVPGSMTIRVVQIATVVQIALRKDVARLGQLQAFVAKHASDGVASAITLNPPYSSLLSEMTTTIQEQEVTQPRVDLVREESQKDLTPARTNFLIGEVDDLYKADPALAAEVISKLIAKAESAASRISLAEDEAQAKAHLGEAQQVILGLQPKVVQGTRARLLTINRHNDEALVAKQAALLMQQLFRRAEICLSPQVSTEAWDNFFSCLKSCQSAPALLEEPAQTKVKDILNVVAASIRDSMGYAEEEKYRRSVIVIDTAKLLKSLVPVALHDEVPPSNESLGVWEILLKVQRATILLHTALCTVDNGGHQRDIPDDEIVLTRAMALSAKVIRSSKLALDNPPDTVKEVEEMAERWNTERQRESTQNLVSGAEILMDRFVNVSVARDETELKKHLDSLKDTDVDWTEGLRRESGDDDEPPPPLTVEELRTAAENSGMLSGDKKKAMWEAFKAVVASSAKYEQICQDWHADKDSSLLDDARMAKDNCKMRMWQMS